MLNFEQFVARHSEIAAQALVENIERFKGIRTNVELPLEDRWNAALSSNPDHQIAA